MGALFVFLWELNVRYSTNHKNNILCVFFLSSIPKTHTLQQNNMWSKEVIMATSNFAKFMFPSTKTLLLPTHECTHKI